MLQENDITRAIKQNLLDAGCNSQEIERFMNELRKGDRKMLLCLLERHRECLLHKVHDEEHRIDCLDYLFYQIQDGNLTDIGNEWEEQ